MSYNQTQNLLPVPSPRWIAGILIVIFAACFLLIREAGSLGFYLALCVPLLLIFPWLHPLVLLCAYFATLFGMEILVPGLGISANQVLAPAFFLSALWHRFKGEGLRVTQPLLLFLVAVALYFMVSALSGLDFERGVLHARYVIVYLVLAWCVAMSLNSERAILALAWIVLGLSAVAAVVGLVEAGQKNLFSGFSGNFGYENRVTGTAPNPIVYGWHLAYALPFGFLLFSQHKLPLWRLLAVGLASLCAFAAFFTFNRQTYVVIALLALLGSWLFVYRNRTLVLGMLTVLGSIAVVAILPVLVRRFTLVADLSKDHSFLERSDVFKIGVQMFQERPVFGVGLGSFPAIWKQYIPPEYSTFFAQYTAPSVLRFPDFGYMAMLVETGLFGLFFYLALHVVIVIKAWRYRKLALAAGDNLAVNMSATVLCLMGFILASTAIQDTFLYPRIWIVYALALVLHPRLLTIRTSNLALS